MCLMACCCCLVLWPCVLQHARLPCSPLFARVCSNSCPLSWWCHPITLSWHPLLFLPSVFPSIRVFSNELALFIRWPKYWNFSFSISPSNEHKGWFPLGLTGLVSLQFKWLSRVFSNSTVWNHQFLVLSLIYGPILTSIHDYWIKHSFDY